jgi:glycosyltransferase involved in cell wall biosynthesis
MSLVPASATSATSELIPPHPQRPLKVVLSAYACEPGRGSEPGVGWNVAIEVSKHHQIWVLTSATHQATIEADPAAASNPNLHFVYLDPFGWVYDWSQEGKRSDHWVHLHYYLWQLKAYQVAHQLHQLVHFDLAHHVTYVQYAKPSFLSFLPIPFIWGPVGGGESAPKPFWQDFSLRGNVYETARQVSRWIGEIDPFVHWTARRSALARATTEDTASCLRRLGAQQVQVISQLGLSAAELQTLNQYAPRQNTPVRFLSIGRLLHWKGFHLGLRALAAAALPDSEYWLIGDGPDLDRLQDLVVQLGIQTQVKFLGKLSRSQTLEQMGHCDVLVHPSLHESGGLVCLEAMAAGRPVICLDLGGPGAQVTAETGFKIAALNPNQSVQEMATAMRTLANTPALRSQMGQAAKALVRQTYSWSAKGEHLANLYAQVLTHRS